MSSNASPQPGTNNPQPTPQPPMDWRQQRRAERQARRAARYGSRGGAWIGGAILILLGLIFLLQNLGLPYPGNWGALFLLLPAVAAFGAAWNRFQFSGGEITGSVIWSGAVGVFFVGLALALFFGINLTWIGPIALIIIGLAVLAAGFLRS